jgi:hypothetical protein
MVRSLAIRTIFVLFPRQRVLRGMHRPAHFASAVIPLILSSALFLGAPDSAPILPNACFLESVVFVENHLSRHPIERADTFHFLLSEIGLPAAAGAHTLAIYTIAGRLRAHDYVLGSFEVGPADLLGPPYAFSAAVIQGFKRFVPVSYRGMLAKGAFVLDGTTDELAAGRLALRRLASVTAQVGKAQMLELKLEETRVVAVIFGFKGHLCLYRPAYGTTAVKLIPGESTRDALRRMPGIRNATVVAVLATVD